MIDFRYIELYSEVKTFGTRIEGRNGPTLALVERFPQLYWSAKDPFPILALRKQRFDAYLKEFLWEANGKSDVNDLEDAAFLWEPWADDDGYVWYSYGEAWRNNGHRSSSVGIDQLNMVIDALRKSPTTRRAYMVNADVFKTAIIHAGIDDEKIMSPSTPPQVPPCHPLIVFTSDGIKLNIHITSRSQDLIVGLPGDMIRYMLLLHVVARLTNLAPNIMCITFSNLHVYEAHIDKFDQLCTDFEPSPNNAPELVISGSQEKISDFKLSDFALNSYFPNEFSRFRPVV